ncbi:MAG: hypothetical protein KI785_04590 [Devosiaceae bacterium]|nr:hypothetical protein [Devosiaceae bacterium MH13]
MSTLDHVIQDQPRAFAVLPFTSMTCALVLLTALFWGHIALREAGLLVPESAMNTSRTGPYEIVVGGINFRVPAGYMRFAEQRRPGVLPAVDLAFAWPTLTPLGDAEALRATPRESIIFVGLSDAVQPLDSTDLLGSVYREVFVGPIETVDDGLVRRRLDPQAGYGHDSVVFDITQGTGFAARCSAGGETIWATCYRDVVLTNGLTVTYRFSPELLSDWQALDDAILGFLLHLAQASQDAPASN